MGSDSLSGMRFGVFGAWNYALHSANFRELPGFPNCCGGYSNGKGSAPLFGMLFEQPFTKVSPWFFGGRIAYSTPNALLSSQSRTPVTLLPQDQVVDAVLEHRLESSLRMISLEPNIGFRSGAFTFSTGIRFGYLSSATFSEAEYLLEPEQAVFKENGRKIRNEHNADIPSVTRLQTALGFGVGWELPLAKNKTLIARPEITAHFSLSSISSLVDWQAHDIRLGLAIMYAPLKKIIDSTPEPIKPEVPNNPIQVLAKNQSDTAEKSTATPPSLTIDSVRSYTTVITNLSDNEKDSVSQNNVTASELNCSLQAHAFQEDGTISDVVSISLRQAITLRQRPLLTSVFFDHRSSEIPSRYKIFDENETHSFSEKTLDSLNLLQAYYNILNVIGYRLHKYQNSKISITGRTSSQERIEVAEDFSPDAKSNANTRLALARAEAAKKYLVQVWKIAENRISISAKIGAESSSNEATSDGIAENRRIDIIASVPEVTAALVSRDTLFRSNPPIIVFEPKSSETTEKWNLSLLQSKDTLTTFNNSSSLTPITWNLTENTQTSSLWKDTVRAILDVYSSGNSSSATLLLPIETQLTQTIETYVERVQLILFDFDNTQLSKENAEAVRKLQAKITDRTKVIVIGYTDRVGDADYNRKLALERAKSVSKALSKKGIQIETRSIGEDALLFDNSLPEGRFYCRTVIVELINKTD